MDPSRRSAVNSLKELVVILSGITITFAITAIAKEAKNANGAFPGELGLFLILVLSIIRFYHGNMRLLDDSYLDHLEGGSTERNIILDFSVILVTSIAFAAMGAFIDQPVFFFSCFAMILIMDGLWGVLCISANNIDAIPIQRHWMGNNFVCGSTILIIFNVSLSHPLLFRGVSPTLIIAACALGSTFYDFAVSWRFYFPRT